MYFLIHSPKGWFNDDLAIRRRLPQVGLYWVVLSWTFRFISALEMSLEIEKPLGHQESTSLLSTVYILELNNSLKPSQFHSFSFLFIFSCKKVELLCQDFKHWICLIWNLFINAAFVLFSGGLQNKGNFCDKILMKKCEINQQSLALAKPIWTSRKWLNLRDYWTWWNYVLTRPDNS